MADAGYFTADEDQVPPPLGEAFPIATAASNKKKKKRDIFRMKASPKKVTSVGLSIYGFGGIAQTYVNSHQVETEGEPSTNGEVGGPVRLPAFHPGEKITGGVELFLPDSIPTEDGLPTICLNGNVVTKLLDSTDDSDVKSESKDNTPSVHSNASLNTASTDSVSVEKDCGDESLTAMLAHGITSKTSLNDDDSDCVHVSLKGYVKTRIGFNVFRRQHVFLDDKKEIPVPNALSADKPNVFLFEFRLPEQLPPSFIGKDAIIEYRLRARYRGISAVRLPIKIRDTGVIDPKKTPIGCDDDFVRVQMDVCCIAIGTRSVWAKIERSVFQPTGDNVLINAKFHNLRSKPAQPFVKLIQRQTTSVKFGFDLLTACGPTLERKTDDVWLLSPDGDTSPMKPYKDRVWTNVVCGLPAVKPPFECDVLKVEYFIQIGIFEEKSIYKSASITLPITIAGEYPMSSDLVHLYVTGRKHRRLPINKLGQLTSSPSAQSHLSAISEARESMQPESDDDDDDDLKAFALLND